MSAVSRAGTLGNGFGNPFGTILMTFEITMMTFGRVFCHGYFLALTLLRHNMLAG